ncbi:MAG: O-antigen ligase family protein [Aquificaceae bacterium]|jgi:hypothetical protein|uniref:O-antigen ligase family protein n=1 Tax=Hydrogenobacter sp. Uz 6-8 TaxID=3384828 RepID=UPI000F159A2C|nr:MAG: O-antigen ligase domain-containing protein [Aquificota bacterium]
MLLTVLFATALLSISLFEALIVLLLVYALYRFFRGLRYGGRLFLPLTLHAFTVLLSTSLFHMSQIGKAIERGPFLLLYCYGELLKVNPKSLLRFNQFLFLSGLFLLPVVFYRYSQTGQPAMLWGGWFEVGAFYSIFTVASLSLFFYSRKIYYLLPFIPFVGMVFFTMRRSTMLGLAFALIAFALLASKSLSRRAFWGILITLFIGFVASSVTLAQKDIRYRAVYEFITGKRALDDEALNTISSYRWEIAKAGIQVIKEDLQEGNWLPLLIGHGINSGYYLEPRSPVGGVYESVFLLSEFIEKGLIGLLAVLWVYYSYFRFLLNFRLMRREEYLLMPLLLALGSHLIGSVFTFFWDAMLPLYLVMFRVVERLKNAPSYGEPSPQAQKSSE